LMLIESFELAGISVVSANTDGIVIKVKRHQLELRDSIIAAWEKQCDFKTEETRYLAVYSRDINNYLAIKQGFDYERKEWTTKPDGTKTKGAYANPWSAKKPDIFRFHKNPDVTICVRAIERYLTERVPLRKTIRESKDIREFVSLQTVKGGAYKDGRYLGKAVRWYYGTSTATPILRENGNMVPVSVGAVPVMDLPEQFPDDIDFDWYERTANEMLLEIGCANKLAPASLF